MRLLLVIWILAVSLTATAAAAAAVTAAMINVESIIVDGEAEAEEESKKKTPNENKIARHRVGRRRKTPPMDVIEIADTNINNQKEIGRPKKENFGSGTSIFLDIKKDGDNQQHDDGNDVDDKKKAHHLSDNRDMIGQVVVVNDNININNKEYYPVVEKLNDEIKKNQMDVAEANHEEEVSTIMMRMLLKDSSVSETLSMELRAVDFSLSMNLDTDGNSGNSIKVEQLAGLIDSPTPAPALEYWQILGGKYGGTTINTDPSSPAAAPSSSSSSSESVDNANGSSPSSQSQPSSPTVTTGSDPSSPASDSGSSPLVPTNTVTINEGPTSSTTTNGTTIGIGVSTDGDAITNGEVNKTINEGPTTTTTTNNGTTIGVGVSTDGDATTSGGEVNTNAADDSASRRTIDTTYYHPLLVTTIIGTIVTLGVFSLF